MYIFFHYNSAHLSTYIKTKGNNKKTNASFQAFEGSTLDAWDDDDEDDPFKVEVGGRGGSPPKTPTDTTTGAILYVKYFIYVFLFIFP